ncbi:MAG: nucleotidyltransferase domain-containing protein [Planctomycetes bacterium]|nr:nucleotidyltransferase domain-containing protein [Planctomycetota bacterium]
MTENVRAILAELRRRFEGLYGDRLVAMVLYGSQARGDAEPGSDIDVLVVLKGPVDPCQEIRRTTDDVWAIAYEHEQSIACVFVSQDEFERERSPLMLNVHREGVPL